MDEFIELFERYPTIVKEMAVEGYILDPKKIDFCLNHGIKFKKGFIENLSYFKSIKLQTNTNIKTNLEKSPIKMEKKA